MDNMSDKELINQFRDLISSLSDQSKDFKEQATEIIDNPEGEDGNLSPAQIDKLGALIKLNKEALIIEGRELAEEKQVIEEFLDDINSQKERLYQTFDDTQKEFEEDIEFLKSSSVS